MRLLLKYIFILWLNFVLISAAAQVTDNFSDGNFTENPQWTGDDSLFAINANNQLQSKGTPGTSKDIQLTLPNGLLLNTEFSIYARFNLNPSSSNFCRFYLGSDSLNIKGNINGYYLQFGGHTGNTDSVVLFKQSGTNRVAILNTKAGTVGKNNNEIRIKIIITIDGLFKLFTDTTGNYNYKFEGDFKDNNPILNTLFAGVFVRFTSSNAANYLFDDVYIGPERFDNAPPTITAISFNNNANLVLNYNEKLNNNTTDTNRFLVNGKKPIKALFNNTQQNQIQLTITPVANGSTNIVEAFAIEDIFGNAANDTLINLLYFEPTTNDVIISELMPDPDPAVNLPNAEYVELYNNTAFAINLKDWMLSDPTATASISDVILQPDSFLILTNTTNVNLFKPYGNVIGINNFPSLNNTGDELWLKNKAGKIICYLNYNTTFYNNTQQNDGGYSLEIINPFNYCKGRINWLASAHPNGGTPGKINTVFNKTKDTSAPSVILKEFTDSLNLFIVFNEPIVAGATFKIMPTNNSVINYLITEDTLIISLKQPINKDSSLALTLNNLQDCVGNNTNINVFATYQPALTAIQNDIVISEIMHSPANNSNLPNREYIELFNRSRKIINLKNYTIEDNTNRAILPDYKLLPDSFVVLVNETNVEDFKNIVNIKGVKSLPTLSSNDFILLKNNNNYLIHAVNYQSTWHKNVIKENNGGYSLEIINPNNPCAGQENWAASNSNTGGTPGYKNSIYSNKPTDNTKPVLKRIYPIDANKLLLYFNEPLDSLSIKDAVINNGTNNLINWHFADNFYSIVELTFNQNFSSDSSYIITTANFCDCLLNKQLFKQNTYSKLIPADTGMLVINEILFNPKTGGSDFVELYNLTDKFIDLKNLVLASKENGIIKTSQKITADGYMLKPKQYVVITNDENNIINNFDVKNPNQIINATLPSMNDDEGNIILTNSNGKIIDELYYTNNMHNPLLANPEGVSLERVNPYLKSNTTGNWQSAAAATGFATPTYTNSQFMLGLNSNNLVFIEPEVFTPDGDGTNDIVAFKINLPENGYQLKIQIFNSAAQPVKEIIDYGVAGLENTFYWNGITDKNDKAPVGIYILYVNAINLNGKTLNHKATFVIGR